MVYGRRLRADGTAETEPLRAVPEHGGIWNGVLYSSMPFLIRPDTDGRFQVVLPPSSVLGTYMVQMGSNLLQVIVPDNAAEVHFEEIVQS